MSQQTVKFEGAFGADNRKAINDNFTEVYAGLSAAAITSGTIAGATIDGTNTFTTVKRCTTQTDATTTTLANITGLTGFTLAAGATYRFRYVLATTCGGTGGTKVAFNLTTATLASINYTTLGYTASAVAVATGTTTTNQTSQIASNTANILVIGEGVFVTTLGGTLDLQFAENSANSTSSVLVNSSMELIRIA